LRKFFGKLIFAEQSRKKQNFSLILDRPNAKLDHDAALHAVGRLTIK
jgi:hypothetical protein